ncbi:hypothetical protein GCM10027600_42890 [Nocardioides ginsengisegetis]
MAESVLIGSTWRRNPPGREVVRIERVWMYSALGDSAELTVRAHPVTGGRPLVAPVEWLRKHYTERRISPAPTGPEEGDRG